MQIDRRRRRFESRESLGQKPADDPRKHIPCAACRQSPAARRIDTDIPLRAGNDRESAFQNTVHIIVTG